MAAYVTQDDSLYSFLTVQETLILSSQFYLPSAMSNKDKGAFVTDVINALGLAKVVDTIIGKMRLTYSPRPSSPRLTQVLPFSCVHCVCLPGDDRIRGVSGGERKRVSIGVELISNPSLLFLDEPTSGLDSFQAMSVMGAMRGLARARRTVICAIHQPRSSIFDMLDFLVLVSEGRTIYAGNELPPIGGKRKAVASTLLLFVESDRRLW